jgi:hypothetical protein
MNKPTKTGSVDGVHLTYEAVFAWAHVKWRSFANVKGLIAQSEQVRQHLARISVDALMPSQRTLLGHLNALATRPAPGVTCSLSMGWHIVDLRAAVSVFRQP